MDEILKALASNVPSAVAVICTVYIMAYFEERREKRREENAKEKSKEDRQHEIKINEMWSRNITVMLAKQDETFKLIADQVNDHEKASRERYERMNITQDLIKMAKDRAHEDV